MGGDDSQKLLPWRGSAPLQGANLRLNYEINNVTETAGWNLALTPPSLAGLAVASATGRLGHFWKAHPGQFWRAPKLTISPNVQHHVFRPDVLRYRNSSTRRRNEAAYVQNVARNVRHIGIRTGKPVDVCRCWVLGKNRERVHVCFVDARTTVAVHHFSQDGLKNFAVALSPFGTKSLQFLTGHG